MASGTTAGEGGGNNNNNDGGAVPAAIPVRAIQRYTESKVYTRKAFRGSKNKISTFSTTENTTTPAITATATEATDSNKNNSSNNAGLSTANTTITTTETETLTNDKKNEDKEKNEINKNERNNDSNSIQVPESQTPVAEDTNSAQQRSVLRMEANSDVSSSLNRQQGSGDAALNGRDANSGNGPVKQRVVDKVKINLASKSTQDMQELRRKLESELDTVRSLVKKIEAKEVQLGVGGGLNNTLLPQNGVGVGLNNSLVPLNGVGGGLNNSLVPLHDGVYNRLKRVISSVGSVGVPREITTPLSTPTPRQSRPLNQLSISVLENSHCAVENVEKEKRTPKANQFYRNSEFLLAKDKFPPADSNKKSKLNGRKQGGGDVGSGFGRGTKVFKSSSALLDKLMKHKHGWVFNNPVDAKGLGLHDYFTIIKHPMDLGTVKTRLNKNWYKSPEEFAEDVRLTFNNAMRYNPKGQDVHIMAELLLKIFEDKWAVIKSDYDRGMRFAASYDLGLPKLTSRKAPLLPPPPLDMMRILERTDSITYPPVDPRPKPISTTPSGRTPAPKKPKAKDPHKRDMTYEEKQKLSTNLQSLPSEKLDNIVQIIKKRNSSLNQHDDEIEVDIDNVDTETLWELDRFVTNYKKSLSKNKRKAELAIQARAEAERNVQDNMPAAVAEARQETKTDQSNVPTTSPVQVQNQRDNGTRSSSSSSYSSDSGSSSSDSDSDSSSASESDVGH